MKLKRFYFLIEPDEDTRNSIDSDKTSKSIVFWLRYTGIISKASSPKFSDQFGPNTFLLLSVYE